MSAQPLPLQSSAPWDRWLCLSQEEAWDVLSIHGTNPIAHTAPLGLVMALFPS